MTAGCSLLNRPKERISIVMKETTYRDCEITNHTNGTYTVSGENLLDMRVSIKYTKSALEEIHKVVDDAYIEAQKKADDLVVSYGVKALEAHSKVGEFDALTRENGRKTIEFASNAGEYLMKAKEQLKRGQWLPWLEKNC